MPACGKINGIVNIKNARGQASGLKRIPDYSRKALTNPVEALRENSQRARSRLPVVRRIAACGQFFIEQRQGLQICLHFCCQSLNQTVKCVCCECVIADLETEKMELSVFRIGKLVETGDLMHRFADGSRRGRLYLDRRRRPLKIMTRCVCCLPAGDYGGVDGAKPSPHEPEFTEEAQGNSNGTEKFKRDCAMFSLGREDEM